MRIRNGGAIYLSKESQVNNVRPAVDVTMEDAAKMFGEKVIGVILTGMGQDGTAGGYCVKQAGGMNIAQEGSSCIVNGMPSSLIKAGYADRIADLDKIAEEIQSLF